jgi:NAD-dependent dihydropyrimidine dehydrogenase PreA subunit
LNGSGMQDTVLTARRAVLLYSLKVSNRRKLMAYKITEECIACGACQPECPVDAITPGDMYLIDPVTCIDCGSCAAVCPVEAILEP